MLESVAGESLVKTRFGHRGATEEESRHVPRGKAVTGATRSLTKWQK